MIFGDPRLPPTSREKAAQTWRPARELITTQLIDQRGNDDDDDDDGLTSPPSIGQCFFASARLLLLLANSFAPIGCEGRTCARLNSLALRARCARSRAVKGLRSWSPKKVIRTLSISSHRLKRGQETPLGPNFYSRLSRADPIRSARARLDFIFLLAGGVLNNN